MKQQSVIYLDHAATSWPKPAGVGEAMMEILNGPSANSGRGSYGMALKAARTIFQTRVRLANLFHIDNPNDIVFTSNTTEALNLAIKGCLKPGDHVIATMVEHNSVRRPLEYLKRTQGIQVDYLALNSEGELDLAELERAFRPETKLLVCAHSSNLLGSILPVGEMSRIAHEHGALILVDAAQTAGRYPVDVSSMGIDLLAFPGHKSLLGPQGTGGLYIHPNVDLEPLLHGGTGSQSEALEMPLVRPDRYEAGTLNAVGIAGLGAGVNQVLEIGVEQIYSHEWQLTQNIMTELGKIKKVTLLGPEPGKPRTGIVAFTVEDQDASSVAFQLDRKFGIAVRAGYHCTPLGHMTAGTSAGGAVRASVGYATTEGDIDALIAAIQYIAK
ncbi:MULTISPECIES: aminotransferase class V-fold PLP-dependent enzyme [Paenibacillus]|uniref:cysteine desulfurase n=1 Tax=Paenibacillus vini TaxID=1476024 RepID=A0ABQ4M4S9_9BACL|nr:MULTISPECIES: aminotransferase class V-fold PLP-dependent enzyme [Paenibacillus]MBQ4901836.1 aminotransferase class V-fold PLP-dependent enzyme [Paenibacillus sp. Marseille-P2973]GIP50990.1 cysteine desulfurase [Paenibacillus vini]